MILFQKFNLDWLIAENSRFGQSESLDFSERSAILTDQTAILRSLTSQIPNKSTKDPQSASNLPHL